jgi:hypothetical protein
MGDVAVLLSADDWRLLVFEADPLASSLRWRRSVLSGSCEWDVFSVSGSSLAPAGEVGDPIGRVIAAVTVTFWLATSLLWLATSRLRLTVLALALSTLLALLALSLTLPLALLLALLDSFLFFLFFRVFAFVVANVLVREVALGRPHMIVGGAAKSERENAQTEVVEAIDCH